VLLLCLLCAALCAPGLRAVWQLQGHRPEGVVAAGARLLQGHLKACGSQEEQAGDSPAASSCWVRQPEQHGEAAAWPGGQPRRSVLVAASSRQL
jgi:hypothetical protein